MIFTYIFFRLFSHFLQQIHFLFWLWPHPKVTHTTHFSLAKFSKTLPTFCKHFFLSESTSIYPKSPILVFSKLPTIDRNEWFDKKSGRWCKPDTDNSFHVKVSNSYNLKFTQKVFYHVGHFPLNQLKFPNWQAKRNTLMGIALKLLFWHSRHIFSENKQ